MEIAVYPTPESYITLTKKYVSGVMLVLISPVDGLNMIPKM